MIAPQGGCRMPGLGTIICEEARMKAIVLVVLCAFAVSAGAASAADDPGPGRCRQLSTPEQRAVCRNPELAKLDTEKATLFSVRMMLPMLMGERGAAQDEEQAFAGKRNACATDAACLKSAYTERIAALRQTIQAGMDEFCKLKGIC
jgi:uncharacterized protein